MVSLHTIPNVAFGTVSKRHITRIVFPRLYHSGSIVQPAITQRLYQKLYNECIRPSVLSIAPEQNSHWPIS